MVTANVSTIKGGAMNEVSVIKSLRLGEIAYENRLPCINFVQSVGLPSRILMFGAEQRRGASLHASSSPLSLLLFLL